MTAVPKSEGFSQIVDAETHKQIEDFLLHEVDLLDQRRFEEWNELFTPDAMYWVPSEPDQADPIHTASIFYDNAQERDARARRFAHKRNRVEEIPCRTLHTVQNLRIKQRGPEQFETTYRLLMLEYRADLQRLYGGICKHHLQRRDGRLAIAFKRVDLLNCDGVMPIISVPF